MTRTFIRAMPVLALLACAPCAAQDARQFGEEMSKQQQIYQSRGESVPAGYTLDRTLDVYVDALGNGFARALTDLSPADRWLDIGAGKGQAILDYLSPEDRSLPPSAAGKHGKSRVVAISIEDRRTPAWETAVASAGSDRLDYLFGKSLRNYTVTELGRFQLISDVIGGFSYTNDLAKYMEMMLSFLAVNGSFFGVLQDVHFDDGSNRPYYQGEPFLTEIKQADGGEVKICAWLKRITCVEVSCEARPRWKPPLEAYRVRKTCEEVRVPALSPVHFQAGTPPERGFRTQD